MPEKSNSSVAIVLLAAGLGSRMGASGNKLLSEFEGVPLVRRAALAALASQACAVVVVVGHQKEYVSKALALMPVTVVENPSFADGISTSLAAGLGVEQVDAAAGAMVMLADMPLVSRLELDRLIEAFREGGGVAVVRAVTKGEIGNPVILPRALFGDVRGLTGDKGARRLIEQSGLPLIEVDIGDAAQADVDTPDAVLALGGRLAGESH